jgi:hypothetical protein
MKNTLITILAISTLVLGFLQIRSCNDESKNNFYLFKDTKKSKLTKNDSLERLSLIREEIFKSKDSIPIDSTEAIALTDSFIRYCQSHLMRNPETLEKSVYFHSQDIDKLLAIKCVTDSEQKGIRAYFAKYPDTLGGKKHPYAGRFTIILRAACDTNDVAYSKFINPAYDFGDVCPPNCSPEKYLDAAGNVIRKPQQFKDGFSKVRTMEGGKFRGDGVIRRKYK